jgi:hypothetical protein
LQHIFGDVSKFLSRRGYGLESMAIIDFERAKNVPVGAARIRRIDTPTLEFYPLF